jgi:hypothetical protein
MAELIDLTQYDIQRMPKSSLCICGNRLFLLVHRDGFLAGPRYIQCDTCRRTCKQADDGQGGVLRETDPKYLDEAQRSAVAEWNAAKGPPAGA